MSKVTSKLQVTVPHYGLSELLSEDFEHGRVYGTVRVVDPFRGAIPER